MVEYGINTEIPPAHLCDSMTVARLTGHHSQSPCKMYCLSIGLMSLCARRDFHFNVFMYKIQNDLIRAVELIAMFELLDENRERLTRAAANRDLVIHFTRTIFGRKAICVAGAVSWNQLHPDLKRAKSLNIFKSLYWRIYPP